MKIARESLSGGLPATFHDNQSLELNSYQPQELEDSCAHSSVREVILNG